MVLGMRTTQVKQLPKSKDHVDIGYLVRNASKQDTKFIKIAETTAWNFQQGAMLQWLGESKSIVFNVRSQGGFAGKVLNIETGATSTLPLPVYSVSYDGKLAVSLDFYNIFLNRREYSYIPTKDTAKSELKGILVFPIAKPTMQKLVLNESNLWEDILSGKWSTQVD